MKRDVFEQKIKNELFEFEMPVDAAEIWSGVEEKLYGKKKRKSAWWLWWGGFSLLLLLSGSMVLFNHYFKSEIRNNPSDNITSIPNLNKNTSPLEILNNTDLKSKNTSSTTIASNLSPKTSLSTSQHPSVSIAAAQKSSLNQNSSSQPLSTSQHTVTHKKSTSVVQSNAIHHMPNNIPPLSESTATTNMKKSWPSFPGLPTFLSELIPSYSWDKSLIYVLLTQMLYAKEDENVDSRKSDLKLNTKTHSRISYALSTQLGYGFIHRQLTADLTYQPYLELRNTTESELEALQAQVNVDFVIKKNGLFSAGVDYTRINEQMNYSYTGYRENALQDTTIIYLKDNTRSISISNRGVAYDSAFHTYNAHEFLNVSLKGGYQWSLKKWKFSLVAGAKYGIFQSSKGYQVNTKKRVQSFDTRLDSSPFYRTSGNLWFTSEWSAGYQWNPHNQWTLTLSEQFLLNNLNNSAFNPINQTYRIQFLRLGFRHLF